MNEYIECVQCGFVLLATGASEPEPRRVDSCPDCASTAFRFSGDSESDLQATESENGE